ncbi:4Fe-4S binding protein [Candidatus Aerophobetes bacterium]|nr:4Fe-4S binding protein [Candidatus Aerophobetes bacterium]
MGKPIIDESVCTGCEICVDECPNNCLELVDDVATLVRPDDCDECGICVESCPSEAITLEEE